MHYIFDIILAFPRRFSPFIQSIPRPRRRGSIHMFNSSLSQNALIRFLSAWGVKYRRAVSVFSTVFFWTVFFSPLLSFENAVIVMPPCKIKKRGRVKKRKRSWKAALGFWRFAFIVPLSAKHRRIEREGDFTKLSICQNIKKRQCGIENHIVAVCWHKQTWLE